MERLWAPWRLEYVAGGADAPGCIFCAKPEAGDDDAALIVHRGAHCFVLLNLYPYSNGHLMVAPYRHIARPGDLTPDERAELWELLDQGIAALSEAMQGSTWAAWPEPASRTTSTCTWCPAGTATPTSCRCWPTCASCPSI
jgi:hypothetical protein